MKNRDLHLDILKLTIEALGELKNDMVFLGGSTISLYITEPQVVQIRETFDVDCVVEVSNRTEYEEMAKKLRTRGFIEDIHSKVICRFKKGDLILDVMPTDPRVLGFTNKWYKAAIKDADEIELNHQMMKIFKPAYLIASKIEAFKGRGKGSYLTSSDIEDIVTVFDGRSNLVMDLLSSPPQVRSELKKELGLLINDTEFLNALDAHISERVNTEGRKKIIIKRMRDFVEQCE